jgi:hypothetical protein
MSEELYQQLAKVLQLMATGRIYAARELLEKLLGVDYKDQA